MYDSLDTMLLMGLHDEFADALSVVQEGDFSQVRLLFLLVLVFPASFHCLSSVVEPTPRVVVVASRASAMDSHAGLFQRHGDTIAAPLTKPTSLVDTASTGIASRTSIPPSQAGHC